MGLWLVAQRRFDDAEDRLSESLAIKTRLFGADHTNVALTHYKLAELNDARGEPAAAEIQARLAAEVLARELPVGHWRTAFAESILATALVSLGEHAEAETLLVRGYPILLKARGAQAPPTLVALRGLVKLYDDWGKPEAGLGYRQELAKLNGSG